MSTRSSSPFDHLPWLVRRIPEPVLREYREALFLVRSSQEPLVILRALSKMQEIAGQVERAAVEEARGQKASWAEIAEALNRTRQAVEQRFR